MSKLYYCDKCKTAHHYKNCKGPLSSHAVLGEARAVVLKLVQVMDDYIMNSDEGKELLERVSKLLDKIDKASIST